MTTKADVEARPNNGSFYRGVLWALPLALLAWALVLGVVLLLTARAAPVCRENPLAVYGDQASRYKLVDPCVTLSGDVLMMAQEAAELGGEKHIWLSVAGGWIEAEFADAAAIPPLSQLGALRTVAVTGARVYDSTQGREAIRPAWGLDAITRAYPERRSDGAVWRVWQWRDGNFSEEFIR